MTHLSPADKTSLSIAAVSTYNIRMIMILQYQVVGSIDLEGCHYCSSNIVLGHRQVLHNYIISDFILMLQEVMEVKQMGPKVMYFLKLFYKTTGFKPQAILFFRDGVSEGQFDAVSLKIP